MQNIKLLKEILKITNGDSYTHLLLNKLVDNFKWRTDKKLKFKIDEWSKNFRFSDLTSEGINKSIKIANTKLNDLKNILDSYEAKNKDIQVKKTML